jgi:hypothetical protein
MASSDKPRPGFHILAGVLIGASVAPKLTNVVFAFGLVAAAIAATRPLAALGCIALGGAMGSLLAGRWWSFLLWRDFGKSGVSAIQWDISLTRAVVRQYPGPAIHSARLS